MNEPQQLIYDDKPVSQAEVRILEWKIPVNPKYENAEPEWEVQKKGKKCTGDFEISVVRKNYVRGHESWGAFDDNKLLISHNGGLCTWPLTEKIWDKMIALAHEVAAELNNEEKEQRRSKDHE